MLGGREPCLAPWYGALSRGGQTTSWPRSGPLGFLFLFVSRALAPPPPPPGAAGRRPLRRAAAWGRGGAVPLP